MRDEVEQSSRSRLPDPVARQRNLSDSIKIKPSANLARPSPEIIIACLEWAGQVLLSLHTRSPKPSEFRVYWPEFPGDPNEAYGYNNERLSPAAPSASDIELMESIYAWLVLISDFRARRVVCARSLVLPISQRYKNSWALIAIKLSTDRRSVKRLHREGIRDLSNKLALADIQRIVGEIMG